MKRQRWATALAGALVIAAFTLWPLAPAIFAYAEPEITVPPMNSTVPSAPAVVEITFGEEVADGTTIDVVDANGILVTAEPSRIDLYDPERKHVTVPLPAAMPAGTYTVRWSSISAEDGDADSGSYTFTLGGPAASPVASPIASPAAASSPEAGA